MAKTTAPALTLPTIHLNGSSADAMVEAYANASSAVRKAIDLMLMTAPHMRDYYLQTDGDTQFQKATAEHQARHNKLAAVRDELYQLAEHVADMRDARVK